MGIKAPTPLRVLMRKRISGVTMTTGKNLRQEGWSCSIPALGYKCSKGVPVFFPTEGQDTQF